MRRQLFIIGSTLFWLVMMALLIQKDFFEISTKQASYGLLSLNLGTREEYSGVFMGDQQIGFSYTILEPLKKGPGAYELRYQSYLSFLFLGQQREMLTRGSATLDKNLYVQDFVIQMNSGENKTRIKGQIAKQNLNVEIESSVSPAIRRILPLEGPIFFPETMRYIWTPENLHLGKKGSIKTWNPLTSAFQDIQFRVSEKTKLEYEGRSVNVYVITSNIGGIDVRSWVTPEGIVLREEGVTGVIMLKQEGWQIFDRFRKQKAKLPDLPNLFSIPSNQTLKNPNDLKYLKVKIKNSDGDQVLEIKDQDLTGLNQFPFPLVLPESDETLKPFLDSDAWIEANDPIILSLTQQIVSGAKTPLEAAQKIQDWVHRNIVPIPSMGIPQSRQVLKNKKGDCNEFSVLFTALARAAGLPTKMKSGLVYQDGRFYYHAWADVYLGDRWISMDPTFKQTPADVTHIPLVEGNTEEQVGLVKQIGRIKVFILDSK